MPAIVLARSVLLEARRGGLPWIAAAAILAALGLSGFLGQVAITEALELRTAIVAALLRACAVFLVVAAVASSTLREINEKRLELLLSLPLPRSRLYLARLGGFAALGAALAAVFALPLLAWAPAAAVGAWALSLAFECALMAAATLFFALTLAQLVPSIGAAAGLYLLARSIAAIQAMAAGPLADASWPGRLARWSVDAVALLLPRLDAATRTDWLLYGAPAPAALGAALGAMAIYLALLAAAGLFDFHRRNF